MKPVPALVLNFLAAVIVIGCFFALLHTVPARAAECAGQVVVAYGPTVFVGRRGPSMCFQLLPVRMCRTVL